MELRQAVLLIWFILVIYCLCKVENLPDEEQVKILFEVHAKSFVFWIEEWAIFEDKWDYYHYEYNEHNYDIFKRSIKHIKYL